MQKNRPFHRFFLFILLSVTCQFVQAQQYPFQNPELSPKERAQDLCKRLRLE